MVIKKKKIHGQYIRNRKSQHDCNSQAILSNTLIEILKFSKEKYYSEFFKWLNNPFTSVKTWWTILKTFVNRIKVLIFPPLPVDDQFVTNFLGKFNIFNELFKHHCKHISNDSTLPSSYKYHLDERLSYADFTYEKTLKIFQALDSNKTHEHDGDSIADTQKKQGCTKPKWSYWETANNAAFCFLLSKWDLQLT